MLIEGLKAAPGVTRASLAQAMEGLGRLDLAATATSSARRTGAGRATWTLRWWAREVSTGIDGRDSRRRVTGCRVLFERLEPLAQFLGTGAHAAWF